MSSNKIIFDTISDKHEPVPSSIKKELKQASIRVAVNSKVYKLVEQYENLPLECDGMTRVLSYVLMKNHIPHKTMQGYVEVDGEAFEPHWWIDLGNDTILDYRLRMWFGKRPTVPNGIFTLKANPQVKYTGRQVNMPMNDMLFNVLTIPFPQMSKTTVQLKRNVQKIAKHIIATTKRSNLPSQFEKVVKETLSDVSKNEQDIKAFIESKEISDFINAANSWNDYDKANLERGHMPIYWDKHLKRKFKNFLN